jgi:NF-X1-type zinc finger protein NFXL1
MDCHCGKAQLSFPCWQQQQIAQAQRQQAAGGPAGADGAAAAAADALCCGQVCGRELPFCPHACTAKCHAGGCPGAAACREQVTVRCGCRRLKERWDCSMVQAALKQAAHGSSGSSSSGRLYDGSSALKLLPCDAQCVAAVKDKQQQHAGKGAPPDGGAAKLQQTQQRVSAGGAAALAAAGDIAGDTPAAAAPAAPTAAGSKGAKKLSRAERDALAAAKEAARLQRERRQAMRGRAAKAGAVLLVVVVGVGLALFLDPLLKLLDRSMQQWWAPP